MGGNMLVYTPAVRRNDGEWYFERYAYCGNCGVIIGVQTIEDEGNDQCFRFKEEEKNNYSYCPHCAERLYKPLKRGDNNVLCIE